MTTPTGADRSAAQLPGVHATRVADEAGSRPVTNTSRPFSGAVVNVRIDDVELAGGADPVRRDVVEHPGAVAIVAVNDAGEVAMINQYRHPVAAKLWEVPAGLLDVAGEDPVDTAARELREEVDLCAESFTRLAHLALSPGGSDEHITIYLARGLYPAGSAFDRTDEEAEFVLTWVPLTEVIAGVLAGEISNATTAVGALAAARVLGV